MMRGWLISLLVLLALAVVAVGTVAISPALADDRAGEMSIHKAGAMEGRENCRGKYPGKLLAVIVPCIREMVQNATETMTDQFDEFVKNSMWAFAVLVVTLFGVKMLINEGDLKKEGVILLMKIGGVALFIENFGGFIPDMFGAVQEGSEIVTNALNQKNGGQCQGDFPGELPWSRYDCILGHFFGFGGNGATIGTAAFGLILGSGISSGQFGSMLMMGVLTGIVLILKLVIRAVYTYLMALVCMGFLIVISPVLIPLIYLGVTFQYFEHWLRALMSTMIMPLIVLAYVTLAFLILDKMAFDEQNGIFKKLTKQDAEKAQVDRRSGGSYTASNDVGFYKKYGVDPAKAGATTWGEQLANRINTLASNPGWFNNTYSFNFGKDNVKKSQEIHIALIAFIIMAYLLDVMLESIVQIAQTVLGGGFALGAAVKSNPFEEAIDKFTHKAAEGGGTKGVQDFISQAANIFRRS